MNVLMLNLQVEYFSISKRSLTENRTIKFIDLSVPIPNTFQKSPWCCIDFLGTRKLSGLLCFIYQEKILYSTVFASEFLGNNDLFCATCTK